MSGTSETAQAKKRPASQYYWGDWRRDTALQACSLMARGLWHEMNCLMHDCEPYGHLAVGGKAMTPAQLARLAGIAPDECSSLLVELEASNIFSRTDAGVIFSRRMVRDEVERERSAEIGRANGVKGAAFGALGAAHGSKGGRPRKAAAPDSNGGNNPHGEPGQEPPAKPPENPPFASASASAIPPLPPVGAAHDAMGPKQRRQRRSVVLSSEAMARFERWWKVYPRKVGRKKALEEFLKLNPTDELTEVMVEAVKRQGLAEKLRAEGERYVKHPSTWLHGEHWNDEVPNANPQGFIGSMWGRDPNSGVAL